MAVYWCTESLPLGLTALIPLALAPTMGILEAATVSKIYFKVSYKLGLYRQDRCRNKRVYKKCLYKACIMYTV